MPRCTGKATLGWIPLDDVIEKSGETTDPRSDGADPHDCLALRQALERLNERHFKAIRKVLSYASWILSGLALQRAQAAARRPDWRSWMLAPPGSRRSWHVWQSGSSRRWSNAIFKPIWSPEYLPRRPSISTVHCWSADSRLTNSSKLLTPNSRKLALA